MEFAEELARFGPDGREPAMTLAQARAYCYGMATGHYENFPVVSHMVPPHLRQHFANVYAYCRWSDDLADEVGDPEQSLRLLDWWHAQLETAYSGNARHPVMVALTDTIATYRIPQQPFVDLLTAFRRDQRQTSYETFADLRDYCRKSADPVGRIVLYLCERHSDERVKLSDAVCTGLQLANFWQDVGIDMKKGRIYLPKEDRDRFGVREADLQERRFTPEFAKLLEFEVERAERFLHHGPPLARQMPGRLKIVIGAFAHGGLAILKKIRAVEYQVLERRPKLSKADIMKVIAAASTAWLSFGRSAPAYAEPELT